MPEQVDECVKSVMDDNPDMSESRAFAICNAAENRGELSTADRARVAATLRQIEGAAELSESDREAIRQADGFDDRLLDEDPCWDGYVMVGTKTENGQTVPNCVPEDEADEANLAAADDRCGEGMVKIGDRCVAIEEVDDVPPSSLDLSVDKPSWARRLGEFEEGEAVMWDWQGETVHGRVSEVREEQATVGDVTIEGDPDDEEPVYVIDEFDDEAGGFRDGNVAKPESSLNESTRDLPSRTEETELSAPRVMATAESLDTQPIEREELSDGQVAYRNLKLVDAGVWTDQASQTPTLYDERTFENVTPEFDDSRHAGPPVNVAHDIHKEGPNAGEPHEASVAGHIDPDSVRTDGTALFGDVILNTSDAAGDFADANLRSALENDGTAGFSPSVELMPSDLREASHPRAEEHVAAAELTGLGLVRDPASESVDLAYETQDREVALAAGSNQSGKAVVVERMLMDPEQIRDTLDSHGIPGLDEMTDDEVMDMAESLHDDLMSELEGEEMAEHGGEDMDDDEEDDEDDRDMMMSDEVLDFIQEELDDLWATVDDLKGEMDGAMSEEEMSAELEAAREELAAAETVEEVDERLRELEQQEAGRKTLADADNEEDLDFSDAEVGVDYDPATGSMSR